MPSSRRHGERLRSERFVQLDDVHLLDRESCLLQGPARRGHGTDAHEARLDAGDRGRDDARQRRARRCSQRRAPKPTSSAAAPSLSPDELPAVTVPLPSMRKAQPQLAERLFGRVGANELVGVDAPRRRPSSAGSRAARSPRRSVPRTARRGRLALRPHRERVLVRRGSRRTARRRSPPSGPWSPRRTAPAARGLMNRQPRLVSNSSTSRANGFARLAHHVRRAGHVLHAAGDVEVALRRASTARAALATALMPEAQRRFTVSPGTLAGRPASSSAMRATLRLSSPAWLAQPRMTSVDAGRIEGRMPRRAARDDVRGHVVGAHLAELPADVADGGANAVEDVCLSSHALRYRAFGVFGIRWHGAVRRRCRPGAQPSPCRIRVARPRFPPPPRR